MKRRIEITVETQRLLCIARRNTSPREWCSACGQHVSMLTPEEAALLAGVTARTMYRHVDNGRVHFTENADGLLVCPASVEQNVMNSEGAK